MDWINILRCPHSGQDLKLLDQQQLQDLNNLILQGKVWKADGSLIKTPIEQALISSDEVFIYPVINGIAVLLCDLALSLDKDKIQSSGIDKDKQLVRDFYNQKGWFTDEEGNYEDAVIYEDLREVSRNYIKKCHNRVTRYLNPSGRYILDAATGALQFDDYLQYSQNYTYRVCVDFSFQALSEARKKLKDKGIYVLADMTKMPFKDGVMDGFVSLNTIYHIPKEQQVIAVQELYRLLANGGKGVVVYDWFKHSPWMNIALLPFRSFVFLRNRIHNALSKALDKSAPQKRLYFYAHTLKYFREHLPPFKLKVWRSVSVPFMRYYIHKGLGGEKILERIYALEEKDPEKCGRMGEYPMFIFDKIKD